MERRRKCPLGWLGLALLCLLAGVTAGYALHGRSLSTEERTLLQAYRTIDKRFVGDYDKQAHLDETLETMVDALGDRWSYYLTAEEAQRVKAARSNVYVGIGVTVDRDTQDGLGLVGVTPGGPAEAAGLKAGEIIRAVDDITVTPETREEAIQAISGEEGTTVTLVVEGTDGARRTVEVERQTVHGVTVDWSMLENQVGYLQITSFYSGTADLFRQGVEELQAQGAQALVIDVRNNPGGYVTEVTDVLDILLPEGDTFIDRDDQGRETVYTSDADCVDLPMAVLVNESSYSAAEFLAAQLQESVGAKVVGEKTSGKGFAQVLFDLPDGSAMGLSTSRYYTGGGTSLIGVGVTPEPQVSLSEEKQEKYLRGELPPEEDDQLQAAVAALGEVGA